MSEAALLLACGRAGITGITSVDGAEAARLPRSTTTSCFVRMRALGLIMTPTRDTSKGRRNRHVITPKGLALLQLPGNPARPAIQLPIDLP